MIEVIVWMLIVVSNGHYTMGSIEVIGHFSSYENC